MSRAGLMSKLETADWQSGSREDATKSGRQNPDLGAGFPAAATLPDRERPSCQAPSKP
jgi:hypothetical protein